VVATVLAAADHLSVQRAAPYGTERVSGHSLRASSAQGPAKVGVDLWAIQLLGRWGSDAVLGYVREAHLARSEEWAAKAMRGWTLDQVAAAAAPVVEPLVRAGRPLDQAIAVACVELQVVASSLPEGQAIEVAEQLAPQVLQEVGGREFAPRQVLAEPATRQAEEDLVSDERGSVLVLNPASQVPHRAGLT